MVKTCFTSTFLSQFGLTNDKRLITIRFSAYDSIRGPISSPRSNLPSIEIRSFHTTVDHQHAKTEEKILSLSS